MDEERDFFGVKEITEDKKLWKGCLAELFGTFFIVLVGTASVVIVGDTLDLGHILRISFSFGFSYASVLKAIDNVSGGHTNPAVTISCLISKQLKIIKATLFIVCQMVGAIAASGVLSLLVPKYAFGELGVTKLSPRVTIAGGLIMEIILTFMVVLLLQGVFDPDREDIKGSPPLAIGIAVTAAHMCGFTWTGCSLNPARSIAPAIFAKVYDDLWVYIVGPIVGAILAGVFYRFILKVPKEE